MFKYTIFLLTLFLLNFFSHFADASSVNVQRRDMKLASQQLIEKQTITDPVVASTNYVLAATATSTSAATITTFNAQPDVCRALSITPGSTTADIATGTLTVSGTNFFGSTITEEFEFTANQTTAVSGAKAFCTVTSLAIEAQDGVEATYAVGVLDKLGMKRCMDNAGHVMFSIFDGSYESTRATCVADADEVEKNTCDINGTLNGSKDVELFFIQNFRCLP